MAQLGGAEQGGGEWALLVGTPEEEREVMTGDPQRYEKELLFS